MKLVINYDLLNEIVKAKTGFNLKRFNYKMGIYAGAMLTLNLTTFIASHEIVPSTLFFGIPYGVFTFGSTEFFLKNANKKEAELKLGTLASSLKSINIYTDVESIKNAQLYKKQYKLIKDKRPAIQESKFMMLPTTSTFNADEISLQQDHIIGSNEYILSIGEPKKTYSKSKISSSVFAR